MEKMISRLTSLEKELGPSLYQLKKYIDYLRDTIEPIRYSEIIKRETSILHLVAANNTRNAHIRKGSDDAFYYCCHFHEERRPSMRVNNTTNTLYCYGCGEKVNSLQYIMKMERIDYENAIALLVAIYNLNFPNNPYDASHPLVKKYRSGESLRKYKRQLLAGYEKAKRRRKTCHNLEAIEKYEQDMENLLRLKRKEMKEIAISKPQKKFTLQFEREENV